VFPQVKARRLIIGGRQRPFRLILPFQSFEQGKHTLAPVDLNSHRPPRGRRIREKIQGRGAAP
jgi:hypothetical protein